MYKVRGKKYNAEEVVEVDDNLTVEEMLHLSINHEPYTTTMRTPGHEEALARGILLTEEVYGGTVNPVFKVEEINSLGYITKVNVDIAAELMGSGIQTKRNLMSVTSCGLCGKFEMDTHIPGNPLGHDTELNPEQINILLEIMQAAQQEFKRTGGCHAAAVFNKNLEMMVLMEDIGRHNAVDKAIGQLLLENQLGEGFCLLISGRVSYEIVSKCYRAGIPNLAAVSAPSSMAVEVCKEKGIQLFAFCRNNQVTQYT